MNLKSGYAAHCNGCAYFDLCHGGCTKHYLYCNKNNKIPNPAEPDKSRCAGTIDTKNVDNSAIVTNHLCDGFHRFLDYTYSRFLEIRDDIIKRRNAE